jgi:hypothetical protein
MPPSLHPSLPTVAVDIGGVLMIGRDALRPDGAPWDVALDTPEIPGAADGLLELTRAGMRVYLLSYSGARVEALSRRWLAHHRFLERAGIPTERQVYCRAPEDKAVICREQLGASWMVDDTLAILDACRLAGVGGVWFQGTRADAANFPETAAAVHHVDAWPEAVRFLRSRALA